jgi:hypothetical protein
MSNDLAMLDSGLPEYLKTLQVDDTTKALMGGGGLGTKRISIKGGVWRLMVNGKEIAKNEDRHMNVVIVSAAPHVSRTYYPSQWQEGGEIIAPDCWSSDGQLPDAKAANPQASRCVDCPQNVAGSGQGNSRACRYSQRLAVALANDLGGDVFQLTLPSTSIFGEGVAGKWPLQAYAKMLGSRNIPITAVVTEMRFDTDSSTPKINFKPASFLSSAQHELAIKQGATEAAKRAITMTVAEADNAKPKQIAQAPAAKVEEAAPVEEMPEPVKRSTKKNEQAAAGKPDLTKVLAEWDD